MKDKKFIQETIQKRIQDNDPVQFFSFRNKASPSFCWSKFKKYSEESFEEIYSSQIDGVKLKFRHTILTINGRHSLFN